MLLELFRELEAATRTGAPDRLKSSFSKIRSHVRAQFPAESSWMQTHCYPCVSEHEREHDEIRTLIECVSWIMRRGWTAAAAYGVKMVAMSLVAHMDSADRGLAQYLVQRDASLRQSFRWDEHARRLIPVA
jgi:hemerythrin